MEDKLQLLKALIKELDSVIVAFSGGVDSTFLLKVAKDVLGDKVLAVTALSAVQIESEMEETKSIAADLNAEHIIIETNEMENEDYVSNPVNRCYHCKHILYTDILKVAAENNIKYVIEGTNSDDTYDYRPGLKALRELEILSPLKQCGISKDEIREFSRKMGLKTSAKPALACLSSRIPYGTRITEDKLRRIDKAESFLRSEGFFQVRVRDHGEVARIELDPESIPNIINNNFYKTISDKLKEFGYTYVALDLDGYSMGSLNKTVLNNGSKKNKRTA